jgi:hypothetical protein
MQLTPTPHQVDSLTLANLGLVLSLRKFLLLFVNSSLNLATMLICSLLSCAFGLGLVTCLFFLEQMYR